LMTALADQELLQRKEPSPSAGASPDSERQTNGSGGCHLSRAPPEGHEWLLICLLLTALRRGSRPPWASFGGAVEDHSEK
jgi:hypothetical protein